jgi:aryl-phospho-beta-D-glucosidase BglC (GH1 family)
LFVSFLQSPDRSTDGQTRNGAVEDARPFPVASWVTRIQTVRSALAVLLIASLPGAITAISQASALSVKNSQIGVNLSALENGQNRRGMANRDYGLPTDAEFDFLRSKNLAVVRLPFKWERLQPIRSGPLDSAYLSYLQTAVRKAAVRGMKIVLDCHNFGGYDADKIGGGKVTTADFADLWSRLAIVFAGNPGVAGYDLMNEPSNMPAPGAWQKAAQAAINAIRKVDGTTLIYVEGNNYSSAFTWVDQNRELYKITDPSHLLVFSAHTYLDRDNSGTHYSWTKEVAAGDRLTGLPLDTDIGIRRVTGFVRWLGQHNVHGNIGETGAGNDDPNWLTALDREIAFLTQNHVTVFYWNLGPFFTSYPYSIEPDGTQVDKVQVAVLTKYTNAAQPTTYTLKKLLVANATSLPKFTLRYNGLIKKPITFVPNDAGAGGKFAPAKITMPPGFNGAAEFEYTPRGRDEYRIGLTNNAGLTDPPSIFVRGIGHTDDLPRKPD